jgi:hypothetical protein
MRDVSRSTHPVDASPIAWKGRAIVFDIEHDRRSPNRTHHFDATFERSSRFVYETPLGSSTRPAGDRSLVAGGRYEYRRYVRDVGVRGLDLALGAQGGVAGWWTTQHYDPDIVVRDRQTEFSVAIATGARFHRSQKFELQVSWINGGTIGHAPEKHSKAVGERVNGWGGGWLTDLVTRADVRVRGTTSLFASFFTTGRGRYASHDSFASGRQHLLIGVCHGF